MAKLRQIHFPLDIPVLIRTIDSIPEDEFGKYASEQFKSEESWDSIKHTSSLRKVFRQQKPWDRAVYILVSEHPELIQIRYGKKIRLDAYSLGCIFIPGYPTGWRSIR